MGLDLTKEFFFFFQCVFIFETETEHEQGRDTERRGHRIQSRLQALRSAQSPTRGSNSSTAQSRPEPRSDGQPTEPPRHPSKEFYNSKNNNHSLNLNVTGSIIQS